MSTVDPVSGRVIADDAQALLAAFRDAGSPSFETLGVDGARSSYSASCARNGLSRDDLFRVEDIAIAEGVTVRVYDPEAETGAPVILFIHGGGWLMGDLDTHDGLCRRLAARTGLAVVAVAYRLAPEHPYPASIDDCRTAINWLMSPSAPLQPSALGLVGDSAGGHLAASLAIELSRSPRRIPVRAQALLYPVTDLTMTGSSYGRITNGFPLVASTMTWFINHYVPNEEDRGREDLNPLRAQLPYPMPSSYICTVDNDPLADDGIRYAAALASAGADVQTRHLAGYSHGLFTSAGQIPTGERVINEICDFLSVALQEGADGETAEGTT